MSARTSIPDEQLDSQSTPRDLVGLGIAILVMGAAQAIIDVVSSRASKPLHSEFLDLIGRHHPCRWFPCRQAKVHLHLVGHHQIVERPLRLSESKLVRERLGNSEGVVAQGPSDGYHVLHRAHLEVERKLPPPA